MFIGFCRTVWRRGSRSTSFSGFIKKTVFCIYQAPWGIYIRLPILHHSTTDSMCFYSCTCSTLVETWTSDIWEILLLLRLGCTKKENGLMLFQVVPAGGSSTIHLSFTPLTLSDLAASHTCVGYALGFMSLDSKVCSLSDHSLRKCTEKDWSLQHRRLLFVVVQVAPSLEGKVTRAQGYELEPLRLDMLAYVKPAMWVTDTHSDEEHSIMKPLRRYLKIKIKTWQT